MATAPVTVIEGRGAAKAVKKLDRMGARAHDVRPVARALTPIFQRDEQRRFDTQGPGWPRLKPRTRVRKAREGLDPRPLRASGTLYRSLIHAQGEARANDELAFGTTVYYGRFHQKGTKKAAAEPGKRKRSRMPKREIIHLSPQAQKQMVAVIGDYVAATDEP